MPSPIQGGMNNPMWSAGPSNAAASPGMATGMRRLGDMQPWEIPTEQPYTVPGPPTASAAAAMGRDRPEEAAFSDALGRLVRGEAEAAETISTFADICRARAAELKDFNGTLIYAIIIFFNSLIQTIFLQQFIHASFMSGKTIKDYVLYIYIFTTHFYFV